MDNFWPALKNVAEIGKFNWAEYVLQEVWLACLDANSASRNKAVPNPPPVCLLFLQVRGVTYFFHFSFCEFLNKPRNRNDCRILCPYARFTTWTIRSSEQIRYRRPEDPDPYEAIRQGNLVPPNHG
jgi:hypothetical protein